MGRKKFKWPMVLTTIDNNVNSMLIARARIDLLLCESLFPVVRSHRNVSNPATMRAYLSDISSTNRAIALNVTTYVPSTGFFLM